MKKDKLDEEICEAMLELAEEEDEEMERWAREHPEESARLRKIAEKMRKKLLE